LIGLRLRIGPENGQVAEQGESLSQDSQTLLVLFRNANEVKVFQRESVEKLRLKVREIPGKQKVLQGPLFPNHPFPGFVSRAVDATPKKEVGNRSLKRIPQEGNVNVPSSGHKSDSIEPGVLARQKMAEDDSLRERSVLHAVGDAFEVSLEITVRQRGVVVSPHLVLANFGVKGLGERCSGRFRYVSKDVSRCGSLQGDPLETYSERLLHSPVPAFSRIPRGLP